MGRIVIFSNLLIFCCFKARFQTQSKNLKASVTNVVAFDLVASHSLLWSFVGAKLVDF